MSKSCSSIWFCDWTKYKTIVKQWDAKGIRFITDLYNTNNGKIYSKRELENVYEIRLTFLCYAKLIRSLPRSLQKQANIANLIKPNIPYKIEMALNHKKFSRVAYNTFVEKLSSNNNVSDTRLERKWNTDIGTYTKGTLNKVSQATTSIFLLYLHFRITTRIYATNKYLACINMRENNKCTFCDSATETIAHLFWHCSLTQIFIKEILSHIRTAYNITIELNVTSWFMLKDLSEFEVLLGTLMKTHIHKVRLKSAKPSLQAMLQTLKFEAINEYRIAKNNIKMGAFEEKWGELRRIREYTASSPSGRAGHGPALPPAVR